MKKDKLVVFRVNSETWKKFREIHGRKSSARLRELIKNHLEDPKERLEEAEKLIAEAKELLEND